MRETAMRARGLLDAAAAGDIAAFVRRRQNPDGGFRGRSGESDLYYTVFALGCLEALDSDIPVKQVSGFLRGFGLGRSLDFVHLVCLIRAAAAGRGVLRGLALATMLRRLEGFRSADGGYAPLPGSDRGSAYGCFLALLAYQDADRPPPRPQGLLNCLAGLRTPDAGYANEPASAAGVTTATAAAAVVLRQLGAPPQPDLLDWLRSRALPTGGFAASPSIQVADLLSTATALYALREHRQAPAQVAAHIGFVQSLWHDSGGFQGSAFDPIPDCEYTYYALLALGCLAG